LKPEKALHRGLKRGKRNIDVEPISTIGGEAESSQPMSQRKNKVIRLIADFRGSDYDDWLACATMLWGCPSGWPFLYPYVLDHLNSVYVQG
jgi:hypothetical protein